MSYSVGRMGSTLLIVFSLLFVFTSRAFAFDKPAQDNSKKIEAKIKQFHSGTRIQIKLTSGQTLKGKLGDLTDGGFRMKVETVAGIEERTFGFSEVKSVKSIMTTKAKWIMSGVITGAALGAMVAIGARVD